jgi:hypothetical protein
MIFPVTSSSQLRRNRVTIIGIILICFIPFSFAWYLAKHPEWVKTRPKDNYGHLIDPARPLEYAELTGIPITPAETLNELKGHWILLQVSSTPSCSDLCRETAYKTGQLRLMLNKELSRVRRLLLMPGAPGEPALGGLEESDPTLLAAGLSEPLLARLREAVGGPLTDGMVLLVDPFANVMMWYPAGFDPRRALRDLQRLLRISQIG